MGKYYYPESKKKENLKYKSANREKLRDYNHQYYLENRDRILAKNKVSEGLKEYHKKYRQNLPKVTYRYEDITGRVVYVGSGSTVRAKSHKYGSSWWHSALTLIMVEQPSIAYARRDEYQWIIDFDPLYNKDK